MTDQPCITTCPAATWAGLTICVTCPTPEPGTACAREPDTLLRAATARTTPDNPAASNNGLRARYAAAIVRGGGCVDLAAATDAVMAVRDEELARLRTDLAAETALRKERTDLYALWRSKANKQGAELQQLRASVRVASALHRSAEATVTRVIDLAEQWTTAGVPPLGTLINRWWDRRLAELSATITDPAPDGPADTTPAAPDIDADNHQLRARLDRIIEHRDQLAATLREVLDQFATWPAGGTFWPEPGVVAKVSAEDWDRWDAVITPAGKPGPADTTPPAEQPACTPEESQ